MIYRLMRCYYSRSRRGFVLDLYNSNIGRGLELFYYRPDWTIGKAQRMHNSIYKYSENGDIKTLTEWDKIFTDFEGVI